MNRRGRRLLTFAVLTGLMASAACTRHMKPQAPCNFVQNGFKQRVSWKDEAPVHIWVHESVPAEYHQAIQSAADKWNAPGKQVIVIDGFNAGGKNIPKHDGYSVIYWLQSWEVDASHLREQARTTVYWSGSRIYEADVRINAFKFKFTTDVSAAGENVKVDMESLMIHEFGHVLGLQHNSSQSSVMYEDLKLGVPRQELSPSFDITSLKCEY